MSARPKPLPTLADPALELLREVLVELRAIRAALEDRDAAEPVPLRLADRQALERLLPVVAAQFPNCAFSVWELCDAAGNRTVAGNDMRLAIGGLSPQRLGLLLRSCAESGGVNRYQVRRAGQDGSGARWELIANPSPFTEAAAPGKN